jgi:acyl-CoA thioesterase-1
MGGNARNFIRVFVLLTVVSAMAFAPGIRPAKAETEVDTPIKIMPFGDSITSSFSPYSSYRCWLDHLLDAANITFIYSGSQTKDSYGADPPPCGNPLTDFDHRHEGYSGWATYNFLDPAMANYIDKILNRVIYGTSIPNVPDIVLMHLGTNDLGQGRPISQIITNLGLLIDHFRAKNPKVAIMVAQIIPCSGHDWCYSVDDLNAAIPGLASQKNTLFSPVMVVDMFSNYDPLVDNVLHNDDYVHPNNSGDAKMATRWMTAIQNYLNRTVTQTFIPTVITP